jgi:hypothetical protein
MSGSKGYWFLLTGLLIGLALGLLYTRVMEPVQYYDVSPVSLSEADKDQYRGMVALAYDANGDIGRARARLRLLGDAKTVWSLSAQAQRIWLKWRTRHRQVAGAISLGAGTGIGFDGHTHLNSRANGCG